MIIIKCKDGKDNFEIEHLVMKLAEMQVRESIPDSEIEEEFRRFGLNKEQAEAVVKEAKKRLRDNPAQP